MFLIMSLPMAPQWRIALLLVWLADSLRELHALRCGSARVRRLRLNQCGEITAESPCGSQLPMTLLSGSMVLRRVAWLRLRFPDNRRYAELICGNPAKEPAWHRLQLIWQHSGRAFGRKQLNC
jgi:hypothetical protein